jgi:hypothetical protein
MFLDMHARPPGSVVHLRSAPEHASKQSAVDPSPQNALAVKPEMTAQPMSAATLHIALHVPLLKSASVLSLGVDSALSESSGTSELHPPIIGTEATAKKDSPITKRFIGCSWVK